MLLIVVVMLAATAAVTAYYRRNGVDAPAVTTAVVERGDVVRRVQATGRLEAVTTVEVGSQVSGTIASLHADYNSQVRKGQVVAKLEPSLFQTQVEQSRATLLRVQADLERARVALEDARVRQKRAETLSSQQLLPASELDAARVATLEAEAALKSAQAQVTQARAALNQAQVNLSHTTITAPIDGIVISRNVDVGQTVAASMQAPVLFTIAQDLRQMQVEASVDEADIGRIQPEQRVTFQVDAYPGRTFDGTVRQVRLAPVVEQNVVSYVTVVDVPNPRGELKPGMTATVSIEIARADDVLKVPAAALRFAPDAELRKAHGLPDAAAAAARGARGSRGSRQVWLLGPEGRLQAATVETGVSDGTTVAVTGGELREGARVVTGQTAPATASAAPAGGTSPLVPQRPRRSGTGSRQGAGGGR
jgi:HlyD family secretion protein